LPSSIAVRAPESNVGNEVDLGWTSVDLLVNKLYRWSLYDGSTVISSILLMIFMIFMIYIDFRGGPKV